MPLKRYIFLYTNFIKLLNINCHFFTITKDLCNFKITNFSAKFWFCLPFQSCPLWALMRTEQSELLHLSFCLAKTRTSFDGSEISWVIFFIDVIVTFAYLHWLVLLMTIYKSSALSIKLKPLETAKASITRLISESVFLIHCTFK